MSNKVLDKTLFENGGGFKNKIINGDFDIWQRGTIQTGNAYQSVDRWAINSVTSTKTFTRETHSLGQVDVPDNPRYFSKIVTTSSPGAGNYIAVQQGVEDVRTFAGETVTLSFYAKADSSKNIATEFYQHFGSGGSPSADGTGSGVTTHALTTSWQKFTVTTAIPSISGKTLGTNGSDQLNFVFWFDAGSDFNARTNSLGQQSGTFDISHVQLEKGNVATDFEKRHISQELTLCQRYYEITTAAWAEPSAASGTYANNVHFATPKRTTGWSINIVNEQASLTASGTQADARVSGFTWNVNSSGGAASRRDRFEIDDEL
jgi:hypothetical protein